MILEVMAAFFTAVSFGVLFNVKGKYLLIAGVGGGLSWFVYKFCLIYNLSESISLFMAAICFSIYCEISARVYKTPATILSVCCLIPLVPGYGVYNTMYEFIRGNYIEAIDFGINTFSSAGSLALGVIFISTLFRRFNLHKFCENIISYTLKINTSKSDVKSSVAEKC